VAQDARGRRTRLVQRGAPRSGAGMATSLVATRCAEAADARDAGAAAPAGPAVAGAAAPGPADVPSGGDSVCEAALGAVRRRGDRFPGELRALPEGYGADGMCPYHRYLPADHGQEAPGAARPQAADGADLGHATSWSPGDVQRSMPKPERMKDLVKYKGPAGKGAVLKQAATNAELQRAIESGDSDHAAAVLKFGLARRCINVNAPLFPKRECVLHLAARKNHRDICVMLLEAKAELHSEEITDGRQPLHDACAHGAYDVAELLLDRRARLEECTFTGMRPLHWAASAGHRDVADMLLDRGASVLAASSNTWQPLHHAARGGHAAVVRLLCARGARLDAETHGGQRPLQLACHGGHVEVAAALMDHGALGVLEDFGETGSLAKWRDTALEELLRHAERLRFRQDEAEEAHDLGDTDSAVELYHGVISEYRKLGFVASLAAVQADMARFGLESPPAASP